MKSLLINVLLSFQKLTLNTKNILWLVQTFNFCERTKNLEGIINQGEIQSHSIFLGKIKTKLLESDNERKFFKSLTTCESLHGLEADHRGGSRTAKTSGMELLVAMVNSYYQWTIVTKISVLVVETVLPEHTGLDDEIFQLSTSPFLKVDSNQRYILMYC